MKNQLWVRINFSSNANIQFLFLFKINPENIRLKCGIIRFLKPNPFTLFSFKKYIYTFHDNNLRIFVKLHTFLIL